MGLKALLIFFGFLEKEINVKKLIGLLATATMLSACENLNANANYNGNHINANYGESGINAKVNTSNATIDYHKPSAYAQ